MWPLIDIRELWTWIWCYIFEILTLNLRETSGKYFRFRGLTLNPLDYSPMLLLLDLGSIFYLFLLLFHWLVSQVCPTMQPNQPNSNHLTGCLYKSRNLKWFQWSSQYFITNMINIIQYNTYIIISDEQFRFKYHLKGATWLVSLTWHHSDSCWYV